MRSTRREFLRVGLSGLSVVSLGATVPAFVSKFAFAGPATAPTTGPTTSSVSGDNILVVVQLSGGNDGLNTVVPVGQDPYYKLRPQIGLKQRLHTLNDRFALNPGLAGFKRMFDDGKLAIVNGCGYPNPNRSHFESMDIWHTADPNGGTGHGWLGHYLDHCLRGTASEPNPLGAVSIGPAVPHALVNDLAPVPSIQSLNDFAVQFDPNTRFDARMEEQIVRDLNAAREGSAALQFLARQATNAIVSAEQIRKLTDGYAPDAQYPGGLGERLRLIAQLICGNFGTRVFYCEIGGFDTHANQTTAHENLLKQVADSIEAFHKDLGAKGYGDKVVTMCFSEFGRRVAQNDSNGTDHGTAGPMFVCGNKVKGGLFGDYPSMEAEAIKDGDLKYTTDFRRVYSTLLDRWLAADSAAVLKNRFEPIALL